MVEFLMSKSAFGRSRLIIITYHIFIIVTEFNELIKLIELTADNVIMDY